MTEVERLPARNPWVDLYQSQVGVGLQTFALPTDPRPGESVVRAGLLAEKVGLDAFFIGDHPGYASEAWLHLAAIAAQTQHIRLGSIVFCASYRHPVHFARLAADFDQLSNGRLITGLGIGWNQEEFAQLDIPMTPVPDRQAALEEYVRIVECVWGESPCDFRGKFWSTAGGRVSPAPVQQPRPPLILAGAGERTTLRQVARLADACNFGPGRNVGAATSVDEVRRKLGVLERHCEDVGRMYDDLLKTHYTSWLMLAESEEEAWAKVNRYYPQGMNEDQRLTRIYGTPERVAEYYRPIIEAGMQYLVMQVLDASDEETIRLLGTQLMPMLKEISR